MIWDMSESDMVPLKELRDQIADLVVEETSHAVTGRHESPVGAEAYFQITTPDGRRAMVLLRDITEQKARRNRLS